MAKGNPKKSRIKFCGSDLFLQILTTFLLLFILIIVAYPVVYIIACSFSSATAIDAGRVTLWPIVRNQDYSYNLGVTLAGYQFVFKYKNIWIGYRNTFLYTVIGTAINIFMSIICAYPLSKPNFQGRRAYMNLFFFSMLFGAGLIPHYLWYKELGLINNPLVMILPGALGVYNMIILRTAFKTSIPQELFEAAKIDGANEFRSLFRIAVPLAKPTISVITLYYAVGHWNSYFTAMIYLDNHKYWPLQLFLRGILTAADFTMSEVDKGVSELVQDGTVGAKYALIVVSTVPVLILYAIVQKYFKKGVMVGAVKG